jgi:hypothetical protein
MFSVGGGVAWRDETDLDWDTVTRKSWSYDRRNVDLGLCRVDVSGWSVDTWFKLTT